MADEYNFKVKKCYCGTALAGLKAAASSYRYGTQPQAKCPNCGRDMLLDAPLVEPVMPAPVAPAKAPVKKATSAPK